jgi:phospholipid/cholesterol/gamma-HCH transport system substrate-binding protein
MEISLHAEKSVGVFIMVFSVLLLTTVVILGRGKGLVCRGSHLFHQLQGELQPAGQRGGQAVQSRYRQSKRISLGEDNVNVELAILSRYASRIRQDSVAVVDSPTLIGSEYISIIPGASNSPKIPVGGMIPSQEKKSIPDILKEFEVEKTAMLAVRTIQEIAELVSLMKDPEGPLLTTLANVEKTTTHLEQITGSIGQGKGSLGSLVASRELVDGVLANLEKANGLIDDMGATASKGPVLMDRIGDNLATIQAAGTGVVESVQILKTILADVRVSLETTRVILENLKQGSQDVPRVTLTARDGIREIREGVENIDRVVQSLQRNIIIRSNLPDEPLSMDTDAGIRP